MKKYLIKTSFITLLSATSVFGSTFDNITEGGAAPSTSGTSVRAPVDEQTTEIQNMWNEMRDRFKKSAPLIIEFYKHEKGVEDHRRKISINEAKKEALTTQFNNMSPEEKAKKSSHYVKGTGYIEINSIELDISRLQRTIDLDKKSLIIFENNQNTFKALPGLILAQKHLEITAGIYSMAQRYNVHFLNDVSCEPSQTGSGSTSSLTQWDVSEILVIRKVMMGVLEENLDYLTNTYGDRFKMNRTERVQMIKALQKELPLLSTSSPDFKILQVQMLSDLYDLPRYAEPVIANSHKILQNVRSLFTDYTTRLSFPAGVTLEGNPYDPSLSLLTISVDHLMNIKLRKMAKVYETTIEKERRDLQQQQQQANARKKAYEENRRYAYARR